MTNTQKCFENYLMECGRLDAICAELSNIRSSRSAQRSARVIQYNPNNFAQHGFGCGRTGVSNIKSGGYARVSTRAMGSHYKRPTSRSCGIKIKKDLFVVGEESSIHSTDRKITKKQKESVKSKMLQLFKSLSRKAAKVASFPEFYAAAASIVCTIFGVSITNSISFISSVLAIIFRFVKGE